jgi:hypothetical protein
MTTITTPELLEASKRYLADIEADFRQNTHELTEAKASGDEVAYEYAATRGAMIYRQLVEVEYAIDHAATSKAA